MTCNNCGSSEHRVRATVDVPAMNAVRRYRECSECLHRWITYESIGLEVVNNLGGRATFLTPEAFERAVRDHLANGGS